MAHKIVDITTSANRYDILSQTPENYDRDNYFIKELQDKVDSEWTYRPNRVGIEYENVWGNQTYSPIQVVMQSVKSEKGEAISDDCRKIVFKNILEDRFYIGSKFRFAPNYSNVDDKYKNVWLATNTNRAKMTSSLVIERCNGMLGSTYRDAQGVTRFHYEPVIQGRELTAASLHYSETAISPQSQLLVICQYNEYTKNYFVNQRFIVGDAWMDAATGERHAKVYRIKAMNAFNSTYTQLPDQVGLMRIYLDITEISAYDDLDNRIAYQQDHETIMHTSDEGSEKDGITYSVAFTSPDEIPGSLNSTPVHFSAIVRGSDGTDYPDIPVAVSFSLDNILPTADPGSYIGLTVDGNEFDLWRKKVYLRGDLQVTCSVAAGESPTGQAFSTSFSMVVRG